MDASPTRIIDFFNGEKQNRIPLFQRPYTWKKSHWVMLWDNIMDFYHDNDNSSHFMGSIVSIAEKTSPTGVKAHLVIDGQQRLTTIAILLCALRDCSDEKQADQIQDYLENRHHENLDNLKLLPTQCDREVYTNLVNGCMIHFKHKPLIQECFEFFIRKLNGKDELNHKIDRKKILDIIRNNLQVVMINLSDTDDPYVIFESLNATGEPLSQADLARNYVLMSLPDSEQEGIYKRLWLPMEVELKSTESFGEFLFHYVVKDSSTFAKTRLYSALKNRFSSLDAHGIVNQLEDMRKASLNYQLFIDPDRIDNEQLQKELHLMTDATITFPILLKLFSAYDNDQFNVKVLIRCLRHLNSYLIRRSVCGIGRSPLNKMFAKIACALPADMANVDDWIGAELAGKVRTERWPLDDEFARELQNKQFYDTKLIRAILEEIETHSFGIEYAELRKRKYTVDQIMPEVLTEQWRQDLGEHYEEVHRTHKDTIGNLTLTDSNSDLAQLSFNEKAKLYKNSDFATSKNVSLYPNWNKESMLIRSEEIAKQAAMLWPRYS